MNLLLFKFIELDIGLWVVKLSARGADNWILSGWEFDCHSCNYVGVGWVTVTI